MLLLCHRVQSFSPFFIVHDSGMKTDKQDLSLLILSVPYPTSAQVVLEMAVQGCPTLGWSHGESNPIQIEQLVDSLLHVHNQALSYLHIVAIEKLCRDTQVT